MNIFFFKLNKKKFCLSIRNDLLLKRSKYLLLNIDNIKMEAENSKLCCIIFAITIWINSFSVLAQIKSSPTITSTKEDGWGK